ncbi:MAG: hypothetical protein KKF88_05615 [Alphaproteobacteria bacterium]|nr:hypothetical protein [Alphaproteobacteria bacterium]
MDENREEELRRLKARLAELEAEGTEAKQSPDKAAADRRSRLRNTGVIFVGFIGVMILLAAASQCSNTDVEPPSSLATVEEEVAVVVAESAAADVAPAEPPPPASDWTYRDRRDAMTDRLTRYACTTSTNRARLTWPYSPVTAELCIRQSPTYGLDVYVALNGDGQIICRSYRNCTIRIRFGEGAQQSFSAGDAADGSSNIVFVTNAQRFVASAQSVDTIKVQLTFYEAGDQVLEFDTANLEWPRPAVD